MYGLHINSDPNKIISELDKYKKTCKVIQMFVNINKKYNNIYEILDEYYETRLIIYKKRKEYLLDKLTKELNILRWKVKFIEDVLEKKILIERQKKENIIERLEELEYPEVDDNYDYLIMIPLLNLSYEKIEELNKRYQLKKEELEHVKNTTEKEQWLIELDEF